MLDAKDGVSTIQMYSSTSTITLNMHEYDYEYEYSDNKCTRVRVRLLYNVLEYDYFTMYSSTITLECNHDYFHDYFNEYPVSNIKATFIESLGVILVLLLCH